MELDDKVEEMLEEALVNGKAFLLEAGALPPVKVICPLLLKNLTVELKDFLPESAVRMAVIFLLHAEAYYNERKKDE